MKIFHFSAVMALNAAAKCALKFRKNMEILGIANEMKQDESHCRFDHFAFLK